MNELVITETIYAVPMDHGLASAIEMYRGFRRIVAEGTGSMKTSLVSDQ
jgi:hypothetical protein